MKTANGTPGTNKIGDAVHSASRPWLGGVVIGFDHDAYGRDLVAVEWDNGECEEVLDSELVAR